MYLSKLTLKNFRQFSEEDPLEVDFQPGVVALAGPNDSGKTAIIDGIRYLLRTRDQDYQLFQDDDYYISPNNEQANYFTISVIFEDLSCEDRARYLEYLTYPIDSSGTRKTDEDVILQLTLRVEKKKNGNRFWNDAKLYCGSEALVGKIVDSETRNLLACTYLRPLRDAEHEMSSGRNSRLSQVLKQFPSINDGEKIINSYIPTSDNELRELSLSGLSDLLKILINDNNSIKEATDELNQKHLTNLILRNESITGEFTFTTGATDDAKLQQVLEQLDLTLKGSEGQSDRGRFGLGSNNLLFIACELLLIAKGDIGFPLLLVEEPEAHLHPQRQLQLLEYLLEQAEGTSKIQVIISTHSPILTSKVKVENIILVNHGKAHSLAKGKTQLSNNDYSFLSRFLDVTKSNLFFAENLIIVEGDAEELLIPVIAKLIGYDLTKHGISIINVGGVGLRRYSRIFQRKDENAQPVGIRVSNITDRDLIPEAALPILGYEHPKSEEEDKKSTRRWRSESDPKLGKIWGNEESIEEGRENYIRRKKEGDSNFVKTFVSDHWTFEYDLAYAGLAKEVFAAAKLALKDESLHKEDNYCKKREEIRKEAINEFYKLSDARSVPPAVQAYRLFIEGSKASKSIAAQYLGDILYERFTNPDSEKLRDYLPSYIIEAIEFAAGTNTNMHNYKVIE